MRYEIRHACGHFQELFLYGKENDRESKKTRLESEICANCKKEKAEAEAKIFKIERNLPKLTGTEKQAAWAETLRMEVIKKAEAALVEKGCDKTNKAVEFLKWLSGKTSSIFWINKRKNSIEEFIEEWTKQSKEK